MVRYSPASLDPQRFSAALNPRTTFANSTTRIVSCYLPHPSSNKGRMNMLMAIEGQSCFLCVCWKRSDQSTENDTISRIEYFTAFQSNPFQTRIHAEGAGEGVSNDELPIRDEWLQLLEVRKYSTALSVNVACSRRFVIRATCACRMVSCARFTVYGVCETGYTFLLVVGVEHPLTTCCDACESHKPIKFIRPYVCICASSLRQQ